MATYPYRPTAQHQGPATHCMYNGKALGWLSCTAYSMAMGIERATTGSKRPSGCAVRSQTGDSIGGLTLPQVAHAASSGWGVAVETHIGSSVTTAAYAASECRKGRGFVLQGNTRPLVHTKFKSTTGGVNHAVWVNEVRGGTASAPAEALVYDPAADGRRAGIASAPDWWPWSLVKAFAAALRPWGDGDPRTLGPNRFYAGFVHATRVDAPVAPPASPVRYTYGGTKTTPSPDRMLTSVVAGRKVNVRKRPDRLNAGDIVQRLANNSPFIAYQKTNGVKPAGSSSRVWYGNKDGNRWIHISGLKNIGGPS